jgi:hypothetical protein
MSTMRFGARLDISHGPPHPFKDAEVVADSLTGIHSALQKCLFVVNRRCIKRVLGVPTGKHSDDSNLGNVEAMQWVLLYYPSLMVGVTENISHSADKMCRSAIMHVPHSCSHCKWYKFQ